MKIIRNLNKKHNAPPGGTGKGHAADSQRRCKKPCENDPQTGLNKGSQKGHFHHAHAPVKALKSIGKGWKDIKKCHNRKILTANGRNGLCAFACDKEL